jgi:hypothetical protein
MTDSDKSEKDHEISLGDLFRPVIQYRRQIFRGTIIATLLALLLGGVYFIRQPTTRSAWVQFRPMFDGADRDQYPNGLPFSPTDVVNPSIVSQVVAINRLHEYCPLEMFRRGLVVQESSPGLQFLNLEYQARLSDTRLTAVERQRFQEEYTSRRTSLESEYQLMFVQPRDCARIPEPIVAKALTEILETWASESQEKRGVLKLRAAMLTPAIFDNSGEIDENLLVRADLLRTGIARVIANIIEVEALPGSELIRGSEKSISLREVRADLEDLLQARLDPLVGQAARGLGRESVRWIEQALQTATVRLQAAEHRADVYRTALREYSGVTTTPLPTGGGSGDRPQSSSDVQALTPQIDRTFLDRIVELSAVNTTFRQEITRQSIEASVEAVDRGALVEQYRQLLSSVTRNGAEPIAAESVNRTLAQIGHRAKEATRRFNDIYHEFSRVSLRAGPAMYRIDGPMEVSAIRAFGMRNFGLLFLGVLVAAPLVLAAVFLVQYHLRRLVSSTPAAR